MKRLKLMFGSFFGLEPIYVGGMEDGCGVMKSFKGDVPLWHGDSLKVTGTNGYILWQNTFGFLWKKEASIDITRICPGGPFES
jgi:hypothetical protein